VLLVLAIFGLLEWKKKSVHDTGVKHVAAA
jgi:hypothetical protein